MTGPARPNGNASEGERDPRLPFLAGNTVGQARLPFLADNTVGQARLPRSLKLADRLKMTWS